MAFTGVLISFFAILTVIAAANIHQRPCDSQSDCHGNECCVTNNQPIGRRWLTAGQGHCVPMPTTGEGCLVRSNSEQRPPSGVVYACPCEGLLNCVGNGLFEVPLGEHGTCMALK